MAQFITTIYTWERYQKILTNKWKNLLDNYKSKKEGAFQDFFERHPCMLPWTYGIFSRGAHGMFPTALISQPILSGLKSKIPDFMWLARDSSAVYAVLIEIEDPNKPWATNNEQQSAKFTQAVHQIKDWQSWFMNPPNVEQFIKDYKIPDKFTYGRTFLQKYILIYGRKDDPTLTEDFNKKRIFLQSENEIFMTYDRLKPNIELTECITVKLDKKGYKAIHIQPTLKITPSHAYDWTLIRDKNNAVDNNEYLSKTRKKFLNSRWSYWDNWATNIGGGIIRSKDEE